MYPHVPMGRCFPYFEGNLGFLGFGVPHLVTFFAVSYELANVLAHGRPELFGCDSFVCPQFSVMSCECGAMMVVQYHVL